MFTEEQINALVTEASRLAMDADRELRDRKNYSRIAELYGKEYVEVIPHYYKGYKEVVEDYFAIKVHADKNCFPAQLFAKRAPNQTELAARWMEDNYKNVTNPVFLDFLNLSLRCTHDQNWSINFAPDADEIAKLDLGLQKYLQEGIELFGSFESFFKQLMFSLQLQDAMGVIAVRPKELPLVEVDGNLVISSTELIKPQPIYYNCRQVVSNFHKYYLIENGERSMVEYGNTKKDWGRVYEFYDEENIWIARQIGKYVDNQFEYILFYKHGIGEIPVRRLGGIPFVYEGEYIYRSQFLFATDLLDKVAQNSAYKQASIAKCVFPATVMLGNPCQFEIDGNQCIDGIIRWHDDALGNLERACPKCHGSGLVSRLGPLETLLLKPKELGQPSELEATGKPLEYISPEVHTLEFLSKEIDKDENKARSILHLRTSNSEVKGKEDMNATAMALDMKAAFSFIMPIAQRAFANFEAIIGYIGKMRYGTRYNAPSIVKPQTFDVGTEKDILYTISEMVRSQVPSVLIQAEIWRYLSSVFYSDVQTSKFYNLLMSTDRLLVLTSDEIAVRLAKGLVENWEIVLHDSFMTFAKELALDTDFFNKDVEVQKAELIAMAKAKADVMKVEPPEMEWK